MALPSRAPAAAPPTIAPTLRARGDPAITVSARAWGDTLRASIRTARTPSWSRARLPRRAGSDAITVPSTLLPAGITSRPSMTTGRVRLPDHTSPGRTLSLDIADPRR